MELNIDQESSGEIEAELDEKAENRIADLAKQYREVYDKIEALENKVKEYKKQKASLVDAFVDTCTEESLDGIKTEFGSFSPKIEKCIGFPKEHQEEVFAYLEDIGLGASIRRNVHYQTLNSHYRNDELQLDDEEISAMFKTWERKKIQMRRK